MKIFTSTLLILTALVGATAAEIPVTVSNPYSWTCTGPVKIGSPFDPETVTAAAVTDGQIDYPAQIIADSIVFTARNVPASGQKVYRLKTLAKPIKSSIRTGDDKIENEFFRVKVNRVTGAISSIVDKFRNIELVPKDRQIGLLEVLVGSQVNLLDYCRSCDVVESGPAQASIRIERELLDSIFVQDIIIHEGVPRIDIHVTMQWVQPAGVPAAPVSLRMLMPTIFAKSCAQSRSTDWADFTAPNCSLTFVGSQESGTDFEIIDGSTVQFSLASINTDGGIAEFTCSIYPHSGAWTHSDVTRRKTELRKPMTGSRGQ